MRKPRIKLMAVLVLLGLAAAGCTKENVTDNTIVVATTQSATYIVDGVRHYANPQNEDEWSAFIDQMFALAEDGYTVQFWGNESRPCCDATKEIITYTTYSQEEAKKWAAQKREEGYAVTILFDQESGKYTCIAVK